MKKTFLLVMMLAVVSVVYAQENKRYGIKSGIIKLVATVGNHATNETQYFDNYGGKESVVYTTEIPGLVKYDSYIITVGDKGWTVTDNEGVKKGKEFKNPVPDLTFINPSKEVIEKYKIEEVGEETFLDRDCKIFTYEMTQNRKICYYRVWVYKGIILKSLMKMGKRESSIVASQFDENVPVPEEVFNPGTVK